MKLDYKAKLDEFDKLNADYLDIADQAEQQFKSFKQEREGMQATINEQRGELKILKKQSKFIPDDQQSEEGSNCNYQVSKIQDKVKEVFDLQREGMKNFKAKQEEVKELEKARERNAQQAKAEHDSLQPDNDQCCRFFVDVIRDKKKTPFEASIGSKDFDRIQKEHLCLLLPYILDGKRGRKERVLELMSGNGRNYDVLKGRFSKIDMLEQSAEMTKDYPASVQLHQVRV